MCNARYVNSTSIHTIDYIKCRNDEELSKYYEAEITYVHTIRYNINGQRGKNQISQMGIAAIENKNS